MPNVFPIPHSVSPPCRKRWVWQSKAVNLAPHKPLFRCFLSLQGINWISNDSLGKLCACSSCLYAAGDLKPKSLLLMPTFIILLFYTYELHQILYFLQCTAEHLLPLCDTQNQLPDVASPLCPTVGSAPARTLVLGSSHLSVSLNSNARSVII